MIVALIPAHNEQDTIAGTLAALAVQETPADRIIVVADNCVDHTADIARSMGVEVFCSVDNHHMKAGALNQALAMVLPDLAHDDVIACIDADSIVGPNFLSEALACFAADPSLGGVSGTYQGKSGGGLVGWCQRNEFARWGYDNRKERGRTVILSGAASVFTVHALRTVIQARAAGVLSGEEVYNTGNITEDFELSLALLHTGSKIKNMLSVSIETAIKPTWRTLWVQRLRWDRGINEGLLQYGLTRHTWKVWGRRVMYALYVPVSLLCLLLIGYRLAAGFGYSTNALWLSVTGIMMLQKAVTVWRTRGFWNACAAFLIVFELAYDTALQFVFAHSIVNMAFKRKRVWR